MRSRDDRRSTIIEAQERGLFLNIIFPKTKKKHKKFRLKFHFQFLFPLSALYMDKNKKKIV